MNALLGGMIIGLAASLMLVLNGRVTGISGIISYSMNDRKKESWWRYFFILGLVVGGIFLKFMAPEVLENTTATSNKDMIIAGLLVGFGTVMGSGCTSGHGVCGISRMSMRSILSTITFITFGIVGFYLYTWLSGG